MKIVGIGLPRTATTSLHKAFEILGYRSKHSFHTLNPNIISDINHISYDMYDSYCDTPYYYLYDKIDNKYPNSKFILTYRKIDDWLDSFERLYKQDGHKWSNNTNLHHINFFGQKEFNRDLWTTKYYEHHENIEKYFKNRETDLLKIDITRNSSDVNWKFLCEFLEKDIPNKDFPNINHLKK